MEYVYAALLLHYAKQEVTEENLRKVLQAASVNPDAARVKSLVAALSEVNVEEVLKGVGFAPAAAVPATAAPAEAPEAKKKEEKKEKEEEGKKEEAALEGLGALFG